MENISPDTVAGAATHGRKSGELARKCGKIMHAVGTAVRENFARIQVNISDNGADHQDSFGRKQFLLAD
jgi:hypothetical protein